MSEAKYPIYFLTGVSFARTVEEQQRWQSFHDRTMAGLLESIASRKKPDTPKSPAVSAFIAHNPFSVYR